MTTKNLIFNTNLKCLVYTSVGDKQTSLNWLSNNNLYDIALASYGEKLPQIESTFFIKRNGFKIPNFIHLLEKYPEILNYDYYFFIDDDLIFKNNFIPEWFSRIIKYDLDLSQPSIAPNSAYSWPHLLQKSDKIIAWNEFIECQCFSISKRLFNLSLPYFKYINSGFGLDLLLRKLCIINNYNFAVLHDISFEHPKRDESDTVRGKIPNFNKETKEIISKLEALLGDLELKVLYKKSQSVQSTT